MKSLHANHLLTRFSVLAGGRLLGAVIAFLSSLLIARYLGGEVLGTFSVFLAVTGILSVVASGGYPAVATLFSAEYSAKNQNGLLKGYMAAGRKQAYLGSAASFSVILLYFVAWAPDTVGQPILTAVFFGVAILAMALNNLHGALLVGLDRQYEGLLPDTFLKPLAFFLLIAGAILAGYSADSAGLLAATAAAVTAACAVTILRARKSGFMAKDVTPEQHSPRWKKAAYPWVVTSITWDFFIELHIILAGFLAAPFEVAILYVAFRFRVLAGFGMRTLYLLFLPAIIASNAREDTGGLQSQLKKLNALAFAYSCAVLVVFAVAGNFLMGLFGDEFASGWPLLLVVSSTICVRAVFGPAPAILSMKGFQKSSAIVMLGCLCLSLAGSVLLYPALGLLGIAVSYAVSNLVGSVVLWVHAKNTTGIDSSLLAAMTPPKALLRQ